MSIRCITSSLLLAAGVFLCSVRTEALPLDAYGGYTDLPVPGGATGYFRTGKLGNRWVFATPSGNTFWLRGVYNVQQAASSTDDLGGNYRARLIAKYGDNNYTWGPQQVRRLRSWGFNTLAEYASAYTLPSATTVEWQHPTWVGGQQPEKMPAVAFVKPAYYALRNTNHWASGPVKDLIGPTDSHYTGYRGGTFPDVYDPRYIEWLTGALQQDSTLVQLLSTPWVIGLTVDDTDELYGFGAGPDFVPSGGADKVNPHIGWIVLVTPPSQTSNTSIGVTYTDTPVYSKVALQDFLQTKYGTIAALNAVWGSTYTTWGSDGGWPNGSGLLDENGKGSWVGTEYRTLSNAAPQVRADLDAFLEVLARHYFQSIRGAITARYPGVLYLGPTTLGTWNAPPRKEILRAAGSSVDMLQVNPSLSSLQAQIDFIATYAGDKPLVTWQGQTANADSAFWRYTSGAGRNYATQEERGHAYQDTITGYLNLTSTVTGSKPIAGIKLWEYVDNWGEKANWGLVTLSDNAYDGREAVQAVGQDAWGYATGGEEHSYGNFLSSAITAHQEVATTLLGVQN